MMRPAFLLAFVFLFAGYSYGEVWLLFNPVSLGGSPEWVADLLVLVWAAVVLHFAWEAVEW